MRRPRLSLEEYTAAVREQWSEGDLKRAMLHDLPRRFHALSGAEQADVLRVAPSLTHSPWDALLAAVTEHVAALHGHALPRWLDEPERFLSEPWVLPTISSTRLNAIRFAPAAFIRHGALPDPRDLDSRGGEIHEWVP